MEKLGLLFKNTHKASQLPLDCGLFLSVSCRFPKFLWLVGFHIFPHRLAIVFVCLTFLGNFGLLVGDMGREDMFVWIFKFRSVCKCRVKSLFVSLSSKIKVDSIIYRWTFALLAKKMNVSSSLESLGCGALIHLNLRALVSSNPGSGFAASSSTRIQRPQLRT